MATIYASGTGEIIRWLPTVEMQEEYPSPPQGTVSTLAFDSEGSKPLINDLNASTKPYALNGTALTKNGSPVAVTVSSPDSRRQMIDDLVALQDTIQAATTLNQLKSATQDLRRILLTVVRTVEFPGE